MTLTRLMEKTQLCITVTSMAVMMYMYATGAFYISSIVLAINTLIYYILYGKNRVILQSPIMKIFICLLFVFAISFCNYFYYDDRYMYGLFYGCSLTELFFYSISWFFATLFFFMYYIRNDHNSIRYLAILFLLLGIIYNIRVYNIQRLILDVQKQYPGYYFVMMCVPLIFIDTYKWLKYFCLIAAFFASIYSFKRTGIIISSILFVVYFLYENSSSKRIIVNSILIVLLLSFFGGRYLNNNDAYIRTMERMERISDDNGSGRLDNVKTTYKMIQSAPIENKIIGNGFWSMAAIYKHNIDVEWLSFPYYFGIAGLFFYILFHFFLIKRTFCLYKRKSSLFISSLLCYLLLLLFGFASELFSYMYLSVLFFVYIGVSEALIIKLKKNEYFISIPK